MQPVSRLCVECRLLILPKTKKNIPDFVCVLVCVCVCVAERDICVCVAQRERTETYHTMP